MKQRTNTAVYIVAALLFLGGLGYLIFAGLSENSVYFLNVAEARAASPSELGNVRLFGTVAPTDIARPERGLGVAFSLEDKDDPSLTIRVDYRGAIPDTFKEGAEVIVEGGMRPDGSFAAKSLMTKCPSKYQKENRRS